MQFFVGLREFTLEPLFVSEVFVEVRKRLGEEGMMEINETLLKYAHQAGMIKHRKEYSKRKKDNDKDNKNDNLKGDSNSRKSNQQQSDSSRDNPNRGTLKLDATVADQDVTYPVDVRLLDRARRETESIIDRMYNLGIWGDKKPRTYRRKAKKDYVNFSKKRRPSTKIIRKSNKQQLQYIARNLRYIDQGWDMMSEAQVMTVFKEANSYRNQLVVREVYRQQKELLHKRGKKNEQNRIPDRIVSFHEPWVRPIVRGKAGRKTEFGAKVNFSETEGFIRADRIDFNNFNEAKDLKDQIEAYKRLYNHYPAQVLLDKIYLNRENRKYLDSKGIKHYGPQLGRPAQMTKEEKRRRKMKQNKRSEIEGKFGLGKFKFGMNRIKMRRSDTSKGQINLIAISMNIWQMLLNIFALKSILTHKLWRRSKAILNLKGILDNFLKLIEVSTGRNQKNRLLAA